LHLNQASKHPYDPRLPMVIPHYMHSIGLFQTGNLIYPFC
jgi:hypothetical protein